MRRAGGYFPAVRPGQSVDVQHGFAADAAVEQGVDRLGGLAPGAFQLDLGVEAAVCGQGAQARQVAGPAGVRCELTGEVQRVDPRPVSAVEALGPEGDSLGIILGSDVHQYSTRGQVLDRQPERRPADTLHDDVEIAAEFGLDFDRYFASEMERLAPFVEDGLVELAGSEIRVTLLGRIFIRNVAMLFDPYLEKQHMAERPLFSKTL